MISKVNIYNMALAHLGMSRINDTTDEHPSAKTLNKFYEISLKSVLGASRWPFAKSLQFLSGGVSDDALEVKWDYLYVYPVDAVRVWTVFDEGSVDDAEEQEFEVVYQPSANRKLICSNLNSAYAELTHYVEDPNIFDEGFVFLLSLRLAANASHALIGDSKLGLDLIKLYTQTLSEARRISFIERQKKPTQNSSYVNARG